LQRGIQKALCCVEYLFCIVLAADDADEKVIGISCVEEPFVLRIERVCGWKTFLLSG